MKDANESVSANQKLDPNIFRHRLVLFAQEHPDADEYCISTEIEARELLITLMAMCDVMMKNPANRERFNFIRMAKRDYKKNMVHSKALQYVRGMVEKDDLVFHGLKITTAELH